jgi:hypothetical protein
VSPGEASLGSGTGLASLLKASPSLITPYFGRKGEKDEEILKKDIQGREP